MLDPRSIVFILAALSLLMAIVLSAMPSAVRDRQQGARHWSVSMLCVAVASVLYGLRGMVPEAFSIVVANAAAMGATALIYYGGRAFFDQRRHGRLLIIALLLANLGLVYCFYGQDLYAIRVVIFSSVSGVLLFLFGLDVLRHRPREAGRAHFPYLFTAITVLFDALVSLARIINAVLNPSGGGDFLAPTPLNALYFSTHGLLAICISVGFILMLNERLHAMLEHQLSHDPLTNAYSRPMIFELAQRELSPCANRSHCCCWTSTTSNRSTTTSATRLATKCSSISCARSLPTCVRTSHWAAMAAKSSSSCCRMSTPNRLAAPLNDCANALPKHRTATRKANIRSPPASAMPPLTHRRAWSSCCNGPTRPCTAPNAKAVTA